MKITEIRDNLAEIEIGAPATFQNLALFPLVCENQREEPGYLLLDEAIERQVLVIQEVSQNGSVPDLLVTNSDELPVLIMDGEELVGAKQNRVLNLTVLVPAHSTIQIPVSCVEAGRWSYESSAFRSSPHSQYARGRATRAAHVTQSLMATGERNSNQVEVWAELEEKALRLGTHSPTGAMMAMYLEHAPQVEEYAQAFNALEGQRGALFAINGEMQGIDFFDNSRTFRLVLPKLIRGYALDAIDCPPGPLRQPPTGDAPIFLNLVREAEVIGKPAVGMGEDLRLQSREIVGGALLAMHSLVHLFAFRQRATGEKRSGNAGRMSRPSWRRRHETQ
jgi:hypothetical protein